MTVTRRVRYAELHALSNFTFLRGASHPEELVETAAGLGYEAIAITDECTMSGIVRAHMSAKSCQLKLIVGSELRLRSGAQTRRPGSEPQRLCSAVPIDYASAACRRERSL